MGLLRGFCRGNKERDRAKILPFICCVSARAACGINQAGGGGLTPACELQSAVRAASHLVVAAGLAAGLLLRVGDGVIVLALVTRVVLGRLECGSVKEVGAVICLPVLRFWGLGVVRAKRAGNKAIYSANSKISTEDEQFVQADNREIMTTMDTIRVR